MKCQVCNNGGGCCEKKKKNVKEFNIQLRSNCGACMNVPCFARKTINDKTGAVLPAQTAGRELYLFYLNKTSEKTVIYGDQYEKFLQEYDMKPYDKVLCEIIGDNPYLSITPLDKYGFLKERVLEPYVFVEYARTVVISNNLEPTASQVGRINSRVNERGIGLGAVFVHKLTRTDVLQNSLHIPKAIASVLPIKQSGHALIVGGEHDVDQVAEYYTSYDGRIRFSSGWIDFLEANGMGIGMVVLMMFRMKGKVVVFSVDVV